MAKTTVNALGQIAQVKKQNMEKTKAYEDNKQYEEAISQVVESMPEPIVEPVVQMEERPRYSRSVRSNKKQIGELFEGQSTDKEGISVRVDKATLKEMDKICKSLKISRTALVTKAIELLLDNYDH